MSKIENLYDKDCLFCQIVAGEAEKELILELNDFIVIKNKYPKAPIHYLVLDKKHREKDATMSGLYAPDDYWDKLMAAVWEGIKLAGLDKTGYKIVSYGAGYNHFEHPHIHILGGDSALAD